MEAGLAGQGYHLAASVLEGDYDAAEKTIRSSARATSSDFAERADWADDLASVLEDTGRARDADAVVRQTLLAGRALVRPADPSDMVYSTRER